MIGKELGETCRIDNTAHIYTKDGGYINKNATYGKPDTSLSETTFLHCGPQNNKFGIISVSCYEPGDIEIDAEGIPKASYCKELNFMPFLKQDGKEMKSNFLSYQDVLPSITFANPTKNPNTTTIQLTDEAKLLKTVFPGTGERNWKWINYQWQKEYNRPEIPPFFMVHINSGDSLYFYVVNAPPTHHPVTTYEIGWQCAEVNNHDTMVTLHALPGGITCNDLAFAEQTARLKAIEDFMLQQGNSGTPIEPQKEDTEGVKEWLRHFPKSAYP